MPTDLTERLAAKLVNETESTGETDWLLLYRVDSWLPLLLSEPELVASLSDEVRVKALESLLNSAPVMESAFVDAAEVLALAPEELRLSVLTPRERAVMVAGEKALAIDDAQRSLKSPGFNDFGELAYQLQIALAEARALTPEDTNDE